MKWLPQLSPNFPFNVICIWFSVKANLSWKRSMYRNVGNKVCCSIQANFNQTIFPWSIYIFNLWKFEQEVAWCIAIHWLFPFLTCHSKFYPVCGPPLGPGHDHAEEMLQNMNQNQIYKMFMFKTKICEVLATTVAIYLEAVEQAQFVYCYHARIVCGVMAHLLLSATIRARSVELLTKFGSVCCWDGREDCCRIIDIFKGIWRPS